MAHVLRLLFRRLTYQWHDSGTSPPHFTLSSTISAPKVSIHVHQCEAKQLNSVYGIYLRSFGGIVHTILLFEPSSVVVVVADVRRTSTVSRLPHVRSSIALLSCAIIRVRLAEVARKTFEPASFATQERRLEVLENLYHPQHCMRT